MLTMKPISREVVNNKMKNFKSLFSFVYNESLLRHRYFESLLSQFNKRKTFNGNFLKIILVHSSLV